MLELTQKGVSQSEAAVIVQAAYKAEQGGANDPAGVPASAGKRDNRTRASQNTVKVLSNSNDTVVAAAAKQMLEATQNGLSQGDAAGVVQAVYKAEQNGQTAQQRDKLAKTQTSQNVIRR